MEGVNKIIVKIESDAAYFSKKNLEESRAEAYEIEQRLKKEADERNGAVIKKAYAEAAERKKRMLSAADLECKKRTLAVKQEMINSAFLTAIGEMKKLPKEKYIELLGHLLAESGAQGEITMSADDMPDAEAVIASATNLLSVSGKSACYTVSPVPGNFAGGFILRSGDIEINNTLETIVKSYRDRLGQDVTSLLFAV